MKSEIIEFTNKANLECLEESCAALSCMIDNEDGACEEFATVLADQFWMATAKPGTKAYNEKDNKTTLATTIRGMGSPITPPLLLPRLPRMPAPPTARGA